MRREGREEGDGGDGTVLRKQEERLMRYETKTKAKKNTCGRQTSCAASRFPYRLLALVITLMDPPLSSRPTPTCAQAAEHSQRKWCVCACVCGEREREVRLSHHDGVSTDKRHTNIQDSHRSAERPQRRRAGGGVGEGDLQVCLNKTPTSAAGSFAFLVPTDRLLGPRHGLVRDERPLAALLLRRHLQQQH